jgi:hypothetical protein
MPSFREAYRRKLAQARAATSAHYPPFPPSHPRDGGQDHPQPSWDETPLGDVAEPQAALQDGELAEAKRLLAEMTDYAEQLEARVVELIAGAEPMARVLRLPGVKNYLREKFHPDKYPEADERQHEQLTEALKTINAAYALAEKLQTSD